MVVRTQGRRRKLNAERLTQNVSNTYLLLNNYFYAAKNTKLWLLLAAICAFLTIKFSFYSGNIETARQPVSFQYLTAAFNFWILIVTIALVCIAAIDIFLYKNRKLQGRLAILGIIFSVLNIFLYFKAIHRFVENQGRYDQFLIRFCNPGFVFPRCPWNLP